MWPKCDGSDATKGGVSSLTKHKYRLPEHFPPTAPRVPLRPSQLTQASTGCLSCLFLLSIRDVHIDARTHLKVPYFSVPTHPSSCATLPPSFSRQLLPWAPLYVHPLILAPSPQTAQSTIPPAWLFIRMMKPALSSAATHSSMLSVRLRRRQCAQCSSSRQRLLSQE
ncbi:hypothetical protein BC835DRAFT_1382475 [Cytidiella melzeri]|nr:hypothetical protein BC835DRAFT_1382457 [Cytidiella melzeri]KAI0685774.1 hypothetical protein BC835DRAFT_1382475 [Cytidiella melzeri]